MITVCYKTVRDFDTTIKFDRISAIGTVKDWTATTDYYYGDLIRYKNELYRATAYFLSTSKFTESIGDLQKLRGSEIFLTAAERTLGLYTPTSGTEISRLTIKKPTVVVNNYGSLISKNL